MAKFCTNCGKEIPEGIAFCTECGTKTPEIHNQEPVSEQPVKVEEQKAPEPAPIIAKAPPSQPPAPQPQPTPQPQPIPHPQPAPQPQPIPSGVLTDADVKGTKYEPITAWGYIGIMFLMCIPLVGLILTIVWACGGCRKISKRSIARATLIMAAIGLVLGIILALVGGALINSLLDKSGIENNGSGILSGIFANGTDSENSSSSERGELDEALNALEALGVAVNN